MEDSRAKYFEVASLNCVLWDSREAGPGEEESESGVAFVRAWMARPAELMSCATS